MTVLILFNCFIKVTQEVEDSAEPSALKVNEYPKKNTWNDPDMAADAVLAVVIRMLRKLCPVVSGSSPLGHNRCEQSGPE